MLTVVLWLQAAPGTDVKVTWEVAAQDFRPETIVWET